MTDQAIRVRLDDNTAAESDIGALREWLVREMPLEKHLQAGRVQIHERARTDAQGNTMSVGTELLVAVVEAGAAVAFGELLTQVKAGVGAWRENRRRVTGNEPPEAQVDRVDGDDG